MPSYSGWRISPKKGQGMYPGAGGLYLWRILSATAEHRRCQGASFAECLLSDLHPDCLRAILLPFAEKRQCPVPKLGETVLF